MKPIRTTIVFGIICGLLMIPFSLLHFGLWGWPINHNVLFSIMLTLYSLLLCRWSNTQIISALFPALLLLFAGLWTQMHSGLFFVQFLLFSWIRSGICFTHFPVRSLFAEIITMSGGIGLLLFWWSHSTLVLPLAIWFFFLVQTLYFFIIPQYSAQKAKNCYGDCFEEARFEMEKILDSSRINSPDYS